jgi:hypothetical protein
MTDPSYLCLLQNDYSDEIIVQGKVRIKAFHQNIAEITVDKKEPRCLHMTILFREIAKIDLYFDSAASASELKDQILKMRK